MDQKADLFETLCRLGDNALILGHRLSEWCAHAPVLEEDIALANVALDLIGQTQMWLGYAAEVEGKGRTADDLAMLRDAWDFRNLLLVERPNGDFGQTMMRQFLFDHFHKLQLAALQESTDDKIAAISEKAFKEVSYHASRSASVVIALGDGTAESHEKMQAALNTLWPYVGEMFAVDEIDMRMIDQNIIPDVSRLRAFYDADILPILAQATLSVPDSDFSHSGGKNGFRHSEHLGHLLAQMQWMQRAYPKAQW